MIGGAREANENSNNRRGGVKGRRKKRGDDDCVGRITISQSFPFSVPIEYFPIFLF